MSESIHTRTCSRERAKAAEGEFLEHGKTKIAARGDEGMVIRAGGRREKGREREVVVGEAREVDG